MNPPTITLWTHALAALLFGMLALAQVRRPGGGLPRLTFIAALTATALWALAVAGIDSRDVAARVAESVRNVAWLAFMYALTRRDRGDPALRWIAGLYAVVALVVVACGALAIVSALASDPQALAALSYTRVALRMLAATSALILVHRLHALAASRSRGGVRLAALALTLMWSVDLAVYLTAWLFDRWPAGLIDARGALMVVLAPLFGVVVQRDGAWQLKVSRTVTLQSLSIVLLGLYVVATGLATGVLAEVGGPYARVIQTAFVFGTTAALLTIVSSPWLRAWAKVIVAKHLFSHRYDYRAEWLRFTETIGAPDDDAAPIEQRAVKAIADLVDAPGGLLLVADGMGLGAAAAWDWQDGPSPGVPDEALFAHLSATRRIIELDAVRAGHAGDDAPAVGQWLLGSIDAWAVVPLVHFDRLAGAIVLARPPIDRALDWEDFDLLGVAGRQVASYLAEARAHDALADARRFDEFNRRFAFIMHDLKNMVSQVSLVARNAERHADNPAFRADMVATLGETSARMNALLARLSQHHGGRVEPMQAVPLLDLVRRMSAARRAQHPVAASGEDVAAFVDSAALETLVGHLVQNAIEASAPDWAVELRVAARDGRAIVEVADRGCGMSPAFVRDQLFRPFVSAKPGGFGLGAFEARQLAEAMGGTVTVTSREGEGTCFTVALPLAATQAMELAA